MASKSQASPAGLQPSAKEEEEEEEECMGSIAAANNEAFADAITRGDAGAAAAVYSEEARLLPPGAGALTGRAAAERFWRSAIAGGLCAMELEAIELKQHGGIAYEIGRYALAMAPANAHPAIDRGKYLVIHERQADGSWKRGVEIFNSDRPRG